MKIIYLIAFGILIQCPLLAQQEGAVHQIFEGTRIINGHSVETLNSGELDMIIGHRFGRLNSGFNELFGLDQANIRIGFDYGIFDNLMIGGGRSSLGKEFDLFIKMRLLQQSKNWPLTITALSTAAYNSLPDSDPERPLATQDRLAYVHQLLIARKVSDHLSIQLMPTITHFNLVETNAEGNDKLALGAAAKYQITKSFALTSEYYYVLPNYLPANKQNAFSIGCDIDTGSHVFQIQLTNASGMIEKQFLGETTGAWGNGDIHIGFNMIRTFKLKGRRY